ncbi:hypothetical protein MTO96_032449 [Rhipicephalus appendiculatus]
MTTSAALRSRDSARADLFPSFEAAEALSAQLTVKPSSVGVPPVPLAAFTGDVCLLVLDVDRDQTVDVERDRGCPLCSRSAD